MPKKKGLGRDVTKSLETMDQLMASLKEFSHMPLKKGLHSNKVSDEKLGKMINDASQKAFELMTEVEDLKDQVKGIKTNLNSRFASRVIARYLESDPS